MSTQNEYDFMDDEGRLTPSAEDTLMFLGYALRAYEMETGKPFAADNDMVKELIVSSVEEDTIPAIIVGVEGSKVVIQGELRSVDGD